MKRLTLITTLFVFISNYLFAQWTTSGNNVYTTTSANTVIIGANAPTVINATAGLFPSITPKQEVVTGNATTPYTELVTFRHIGATSDAVSRQLGLVFKLSTESSLTESGKMGGILLESNNIYANLPSLSLVTSNARRLTIDYSGNVGIGTTTPAKPLHVQVSNVGLNIIGGFQNLSAGAGSGGLTAGTAVGIGFLNEPGGNWWKAAVVHERTNAYGIGSLHFLVNNSQDNSTVTLNDAKMTITSSGNIGIGLTTPQNKLDVNGTVHAKAIQIDLNGWNDYVFKKAYRLLPLSEVKAYIDQNQHLPEIPSEPEMIKNGLNVGEMNKLLMKKVEELTLYLIEKDNQDKQKDKQLEELRERVAQLEKNGSK